MPEPGVRVLPNSESLANRSRYRGEERGSDGRRLFERQPDRCVPRFRPTVSSVSVPPPKYLPLKSVNGNAPANLPAIITAALLAGSSLVDPNVSDFRTNAVRNERKIFRLRSRSGTKGIRCGISKGSARERRYRINAGTINRPRINRVCSETKDIQWRRQQKLK